MLTTERQRIIEEIAVHEGEIIINDLAKKFNLSIETIRRDINILCEKNKLVKVHGGAVPVKRSLSEFRYDIRRQHNSGIKTQLGVQAAKLIQNYDVAAFACGSTIEMLAQSLMDKKGITAITNSLTIGRILCEKHCRKEITGEVFLLGGYLNTHERFSSGSFVAQQLDTFHADKFFLSTSLDENGLMTTNIEEGSIAKKMIEKSFQTILVAESAKLNKKSVYRFAELDKVHTIITDDSQPISDELSSAIADCGIDLQIVESRKK